MHKRSGTRRGGCHGLAGAPVGDSLAGSWSSIMSQGQGGDFLKYHAGQHGGYLAGAPLSAIDSSMLPAAMQGPAHVASTFKAHADVAGMKDQTGGYRKTLRKLRKQSKQRKQRKSLRKQSKQRKSLRKQSKQRKSLRKQRKQRKQSKSRGGALEYAPFPSQAMLLDASGYARAGLNPDFVTGGIEAHQASLREAM